MITHEDPPSSKTLAKAEDFAGRVGQLRQTRSSVSVQLVLYGRAVVGLGYMMTT
eukprot:SAG22_NODE_107_length_19899_cov_24.034141_2_plen_54_part_00